MFLARAFDTADMTGKDALAWAGVIQATLGGPLKLAYRYPSTIAAAISL
jgi:hypothetical protein